MAVSELVVSGTITQINTGNTTVSIQPAVGVVYSFKRGTIVRTQGAPFELYVGGSLNYKPNSSVTPDPEELFLYSFSESGGYYNHKTGQVGNLYGSNVFSTVTNVSGHAISVTSSSAPSTSTTNYSLVGVSFT